MPPCHQGQPGRVHLYKTLTSFSDRGLAEFFQHPSISVHVNNALLATSNMHQDTMAYLQHCWEQVGGDAVPILITTRTSKFQIRVDYFYGLLSDYVDQATCEAMGQILNHATFDVAECQRIYQLGKDILDVNTNDPLMKQTKRDVLLQAVNTFRSKDLLEPQTTVEQVPTKTY